MLSDNINKKGQGIAINKLVIGVIVFMVFFVVVLGVMDIGGYIGEWVKNMPDYEYEQDERLDLDKIDQKLLDDVGCKYKVAQVGGDIKEMNILGKDVSHVREYLGEHQRNLYYYDNQEEDAKEMEHFYWEGDSLEELKIMYEGEEEEEKQISEELGSDNKIEIRDDAWDIYGINKALLQWLDGSKKVGGYLMFCRDEKPGLSGDHIEDLENIVELINNMRDSELGTVKNYKLKSGKFRILLDKEYLPQGEVYEICIGPDLDTAKKEKGCMNVNPKTELKSREGEYKGIKLKEGKIVYFEKKEDFVEVRDYYKPPQCEVFGEINYNNRVVINNENGDDKKFRMKLEQNKDNNYIYNVIVWGFYTGTAFSGEKIGVIYKENRDRRIVFHKDSEETIVDKTSLSKNQIERLRGSLLIPQEDRTTKYLICEPKESKNKVTDYFIENDIPSLNVNTIGNRRKIEGESNLKRFYYFVEGSNDKRGILGSEERDSLPYRVAEKVVFNREGEWSINEDSFSNLRNTYNIRDVVFVYYNDEWNMLRDLDEEPYEYSNIYDLLEEKKQNEK